MQNRAAHISVQPGRAGVDKDESNPMVRVFYSATVLLYFSKSRTKTLWLHLSQRWNKKYVKPLAPPF